MGVSVKDFISRQEENGRRSKLEPFKSDILLLKQKGFSQNEKQALVLFKDEIKSNLSAFPKYTSYILQYFLNSF